MKKLILFFLFLISELVFAQVLFKYPEKQPFYKGGNGEFTKEAHQFLIDNEIKPCEDKNEAIFIKFIVNENGKISLVKELDETAINNNKCAYDLAKKVLANLSNFSPAEENSVKISAMQRINFIPDDLFNYPEVKKNSNDFVDAQFPGGIKKFREKFISCFDGKSYIFPAELKFKINFEVNTKGKIQNIYFDTDFQNDDFLSMTLKCIDKKHFTFEPALYKGRPIVMSFNLPITINSY